MSVEMARSYLLDCELKGPSETWKQGSCMERMSARRAPRYIEIVDRALMEVVRIGTPNMNNF